ncbi:hypothetical protein L228DRAFT_268280 [Xylona heveae TC161]|uniref:WSC domain-containing protein n=1 Tax=Xylona heveae (strain CBS 132557 / TC161) TaxID=1328760 RepID=A0A165H2R8_XYLHT|nr:hypothetical protein L228DRAFT_268280 [Xylona heveae TC161]KZF22905.1 hypothetical protein L228DRAFT_268280 [Xylona heveae TC161]
MALSKLHPSSRVHSAWIVVLTILMLGVQEALSLDIRYCSSQNTGSSFNSVSNIYQSNGACSDTCKSNYAFAILQGSSCWCSNYVPSSTTSTGSCNQNCPGYPDDKCGNESEGLYGYIALGNSPSGTAAASSSSQSSGQKPSTSSTSTSQAVSSQTHPVNPSTPTHLTPSLQSSVLVILVQPSSVSVSLSTTRLTPFSIQTTPSAKPSTVRETVTASQSPSVIISVITNTPSTTSTSSQSTSTSTSADSTSTSSSSTSSTPSPTSSPQPAEESPTTWTPTPVTTVMTITGQVRTVTMTPTVAPSSVLPVSKHSDGGFFSHAGKVAGLFVGIALIILLVAGMIFFCCWRRRQHLRDVAAESTSSEEGPSRRPSRTMSENGLLSGFMGEKVPSTSSHRAGSSENDPEPGRSGRLPRVVDQRLDPTSLYSPVHDNSSRASVRSLRDDQDYSRRVLRLTNPDESAD